MCAENMMTKAEHDAVHVGQCSDCGCDVDKDGDCCELDDCHYSPLTCSKCGYHACDQSC